MNIKIETDKFEVLASGSVVTNFKDPLYFRLFDGARNFKIIFDFIGLGEEPQTFYELLKNEENVFEVKILTPKRHDNTTSTKKPLHLAYFDGKNIYLKFSFKYSYDINEKQELTDSEEIVFHYTWLQDK
ncbi:hypothetical protein DBR39_18365 [Chryseobacterium sp. KBW03]|uniref:DUF6864 domain-containing function n=1 Tax=Chryseobacterium sp. KBW03 TaxID=2153362 RepID=UPI000F5B2B99|nr:hypothetical protein [Chryseobacterium sp. KBW03]RQO35441.1 hypothetical protein DBR39_18365 [Chryseobacterium sp. KBW03]